MRINEAPREGSYATALTEEQRISLYALLRSGIEAYKSPNSIGNKAHEIWSKNYVVEQASGLSHSASGRMAGSEERRAGTPAATGGTPVPPANSKWSCHFVDIYTAVKDGLPLDIEKLKAAVDDPEGWAQEFECQFLDIQAVLLPYDLIASCESVEATASVPAEYWQAKLQFSIDMGIDFGRRHDLTVCWSNAQLGDVAQRVEVLELAKMSTPEQIEILRPRLKRARRVCLDYTGAGIGLGDYLVQEFKPCDHGLGRGDVSRATLGRRPRGPLHGAGPGLAGPPGEARLRQDLCLHGQTYPPGFGPPREHLTFPMKLNSFLAWMGLPKPLPAGIVFCQTIGCHERTFR